MGLFFRNLGCFMKFCYYKKLGSFILKCLFNYNYFHCTFKFYFIFKDLYIGILPAYILLLCLYTMCMRCSESSEEGIRSLGSRVLE